MTALELKNKIENGEKFIIFDVRQKSLYDISHLESAINIKPYFLIDEEYKHLDPNKEYYIVCNSGNTSSSVVEHLKRQGINAIDVEGGMNSIL